MSGESERQFRAFLGEMFLHDVGLGARGEDSDVALGDEEFARVARELGLVSPEELERARSEIERTPGAKLWQVLERQGALDVENVLQVFRFRSDLRSLSNRNVGCYFVVERIGEGSSGRVYRAIHQDLLKHVALKVLREGPGMQSAQLERFRREAATAASLRHPNIVGVHDVGIDGDVHYIAMDLVEGRTLKEWLDAAPQRDDVLALMEKVANAIGHAHERGVLHRDIKPQNVLVQNDGEPVVVDFGLARVLDDETLTQEGAVLGTPHYMAPEQLRGDVGAHDARTDVYALGVVLYEAVSGELPFADAGSTGRAGRPPRSATDPSLHAICVKCLELDPRYRYPSASELAADLRRYRNGETVSATRFSAIQRPWRALRRRPALAFAVGALIATLVVGGVLARDLLEENRRLVFANDVKSAYNILSERMEPILVRADQARYRDATADERSAIVAAADATLADFADTTGVGDAYGAYVRWLIEGAQGDAHIRETRHEHPANPFPALVCAWRHLREYADRAQWPAREPVNLFAVREPREDLTPFESKEMRRQLQAALRDLDYARSTRIWDQVPELEWVEDLCDGFSAYARGDLAAAAQALERVGDHTDLALEPRLLLAFAYCRKGDLDAVFRTTRELLERRPELVPAVRTLAASHRFRGLLALRKSGESLPDLTEARRLFESTSADPASDSEIIALDMSIALARARKGESPVAELERIIEAYDGMLEDDPDDYRSRANSVECRTRLANFGIDPDRNLKLAAADCERAIATNARFEENADTRTLANCLASVRFSILRRRFHSRELTQEDVDDLHRELDQCLEHWGAWASPLYYKAALSILQGDWELRDRVGDGKEHYRRALEYGRRALEDNPDFLEVRHLVLITALFRDVGGDESGDDLVSMARELDELCTAMGNPLPWDAALPRLLDRLSRSVSSEDDARALCRGSLELWDVEVAAAPDDATRRLERGKVQVGLSALESSRARHRLREALADFERAAELEPKLSGVTLWRALALALLADLGGDDELPRETCTRLALESATEAAEEGAGSAALALSAKVRFDLDQDAPARDDLDEALRLARGSRVEGELFHAWHAASWGVVRSDDRDAETYRRAMHSCDVIAAREPEREEWARTLGVALYRVDELEAARATLSEVDLPSAIAVRAMAEHRTGRRDEARATLRRLRTMLAEPPYEGDERALAWLDQAGEIVLDDASGGSGDR